jgi:hypothetical protein
VQNVAQSCWTCIALKHTNDPWPGNRTASGVGRFRQVGCQRASARFGQVLGSLIRTEHSRTRSNVARCHTAVRRLFAGDPGVVVHGPAGPRHRRGLRGTGVPSRTSPQSPWLASWHAARPMGRQLVPNVGPGNHDGLTKCPSATPTFVTCSPTSSGRSFRARSPSADCGHD